MQTDDRNRAKPYRVIQSESNPRIKRVRSLLRHKWRHQERAFIVEGVRAVRDALMAGAVPSLILITAEAHLRTMPAVDHGLVTMVDEHLLRYMSDVDHPQGILAVFEMDDIARAGAQRVWPNALAIVADGIRDPGNMGTLMRSAAGAGADLMLTSPDCVDVFNPKCVRAAMGAHFRIPVQQFEPESLRTALDTYQTIAIAQANGDHPLEELDWTGDVAIVVGGEASGPSRSVLEHATVTVCIPLLRDVESLNAGVAGSLLMFEVARQRRIAAGSGLQAQRGHILNECSSRTRDIRCLDRRSFGPQGW